MKRHRTDLVSLLFGLVFLGLALAWMVGVPIVWTFDGLPRAGWFLAAALIVLGIIGLLRSLRSGNGRGTSEPDELP